MSTAEKKDYELYLEQDEETWGEFFDNMRKYWKGVTADIRNDMKGVLDDYDELAADFAECADDPEIMDMAVTAGRVRTVALASEKAMNVIGKCLDATAANFGKGKSSESKRKK